MAISQVVARRFMLVASAVAVYAAAITSLSIILGDDFVGWGSVVDVGIFLGLAFGVYRRSRIAAILLFGYHLLNRILMWRLTGDLSPLLGVAPLTFAVVFGLGILGTFSYHRFTADRERLQGDQPVMG